MKNAHFLIPAFFLLVLISFCSIEKTNASEPSFSTTLKKDPKPGKIEDDPTKRRLPSAPVYCTITPQGITLSQVEINDVLTFEAFDNQGNCVSSFTTEPDFVSFLFSTTGIAKISFVLEDYTLSGCL